jgi:hypothetical protein
MKNPQPILFSWDLHGCSNQTIESSHRAAFTTANGAGGEEG